MHLLQMVYRIGPPGSLTKLVKMPVRDQGPITHELVTAPLQTAV